MKVNIFLTSIGILLAALMGYLAYSVASGDENDIVCGIGSGICFGATLLPVMGFRYDSGRLGVNIRTFSAVFFVIFAISHFCFAGFGVKMPYYVIINGITLLIYLAALYKMQGVKTI